MANEEESREPGRMYGHRGASGRLRITAMTIDFMSKVRTLYSTCPRTPPVGLHELLSLEGKDVHVHENRIKSKDGRPAARIYRQGSARARDGERIFRVRLFPGARIRPSGVGMARLTTFEGASMSDFPRLSFDGLHWAAGDPDLVIDGAPIARDGIQPQWFQPTTCVAYSRDSDGALMCVDAPFSARSAPRCLRAAGGNAIAAAQGRWVIYRTDPPRLIFDNGVEWPGYSYPALSDDGTRLACLTQSDHTLFAGPPDKIQVVDGAACLNPRWGAGSLCWERGTGAIYGRSTLDQPTVALRVPGSRLFKPVPVWTGQDPVCPHAHGRSRAPGRMELARAGSAPRDGHRRTGFQRRVRLSTRRTALECGDDSRCVRRQRRHSRREHLTARHAAADTVAHKQLLTRIAC